MPSNIHRLGVCSHHQAVQTIRSTAHLTTEFTETLMLDLSCKKHVTSLFWKYPYRFNFPVYVQFDPGFRRPSS